MANSKSALKRIRVADRRRARNQPFRSVTKTLVKSAKLSVEDGDTDVAVRDVRRAVSMLDRAARKGIIHPNNAARRKSRLMARLNTLGEKA